MRQAIDLKADVMSVHSIIKNDTESSSPTSILSNSSGEDTFINRDPKTLRKTACKQAGKKDRIRETNDPKLRDKREKNRKAAEKSRRQKKEKLEH
jgi:hypothetical protein